jgi:gluconolactonase
MKPFSLLAGLALLLAALAWTAAPSVGDDKKEETPKRSIERLDPRFDKLIAKDAKLETLSGGYAWTEGPVWVNKDGGYLLFSDIPNNRIMKWQDGKASVFMKPSGYDGDRKDLKEPGSNGLLLDSEGRLILMEHGNRRVARLEKDGKTKTMLADRYEGKRLNSPNDGVFKSNGDLYFTDPPYGLMVKDKEGFPGMELDYSGVYRLKKDGKLTLLTKELPKPNGIAFSPDEKTLYVGCSDPDKPIWMAYPMKEDGTLGKGKVFFDSTPMVKKMLPGLPDGMKVDKDGNVFATGPGGVFVFAPDGTHLGTIMTGTRTSNCNWGDDGTVLYVTANTDLTRIKTLTKGKGF